MKITIDEIALQAGVSKGTVSRVINGKLAVADKTRSKVLAVMEQLGYAPDPVARELSMRSKYTLGIWVGAGDCRLSPYFNVVWRALVREMQERAIQFVELPADLDQVRRRLNAVLLFNAKNVGEQLAILAQRQLPAVLIGHYPGVSCVAPDDRAGGYLAAEQLLRRGHRELLQLSVVSAAQWVSDREEGFLAALVDAGLSTQRVIVRGEASVLGGYRLMRDAWLSGIRPTGVFCATDEMAVGALGALKDLGVSVPQSVSLIGFDGLTPELCPGVASVAQDIIGIAHEAVSLALAAIEGLPPRQVVVPVTLLEGASLSVPVQAA